MATNGGNGWTKRLFLLVLSASIAFGVRLWFADHAFLRLRADQQAVSAAMLTIAAKQSDIIDRIEAMNRSLQDVENTLDRQGTDMHRLVTLYEHELSEHSHGGAGGRGE